MAKQLNKINEFLNLEDKVILITGALGQVGSELVKTFLKLGSQVVATDISKSGDSKQKSNNY